MAFASVRIGSGPARVGYDVTGSGPGLVLVHGTAASRAQWRPLTEELADRYRVVAPDYSGSGETTDAGGPLTLADLAAEVLAAAEHAGLDTFHLMGHSLGATVATRLAADRPDRVRSLALHAGWVCTDTRMAASFRHWLTLLRAEHGRQLFAAAMGVQALGPGYWRQATPDSHAALVAQLAADLAPGSDRQTEADLAVDLTDALGHVTAPTLVLASSHDQVVPAGQQQALLAGIANARYAEIDAGHGAPNEDPDGFADLVAGFLDDQPR